MLVTNLLWLGLGDMKEESRYDMKPRPISLNGCSMHGVAAKMCKTAECTK